MTMSIRDPQAAELARLLATKRKTTMTQAIIVALQNELRRETEKDSLETRLDRMLDKHLGGRMLGRDMPKDEIDAMWGH